MAIRKEGLDPAFAIPAVTGLPNGDVLWGSSGITVRDYFAGKALQAIAVHVIIAYDKIHSEDVARVCYELADAMVEERAKV